MGHLTANQDKIVARVRRIAGQVAALERTILSEASCSDTLHLTAAVRGAVAGLMDELVEEHMRTHVAAPGLSDSARAEGADELATVLPPPLSLRRSAMASLSEIDAFHHGHDFLGHAHDRNARRTLWVVLITALMMVGEIVAGYLTGSMALLADGFHMATHAGALGVAALAYRYAKRHVGNPHYSFGTGKVGDLAGFASALVLGIVALGIAVESAMRLAHPTSVAFGDATLVAVLGLVVNLVSAPLLSGGHHHAHDHHHHHHDHHHARASDNNLRAAYMHVLADALTSVLAIVALLAGRYLGWIWLDPAMGIVGAIVIARWSWSLMRDTAKVLLDAADPDLAKEIRECVEGPGDARIADLHVWQIGPGAHAAILDVVDAPSAAVVRERLAPVHELVHVHDRGAMMLYLLIKAVLSAAIIVAVSEIAKRNPGFGALVASLPLVSILGMVWLWRDTSDVGRLAAHSSATFWYVLPSLPMFLVLPLLLKRGLGFWPALLVCCALTSLLYVMMTWALVRAGVRL